MSFYQIIIIIIIIIIVIIIIITTVIIVIIFHDKMKWGENASSKSFGEKSLCFNHLPPDSVL